MSLAERRTPLAVGCLCVLVSAAGLAETVSVHDSRVLPDGTVEWFEVETGVVVRRIAVGAEDIPVTPELRGTVGQVPGWPFVTQAEVGGVPAVGDLDGDGGLEAVFSDVAPFLYAVHADGTRLPAFPLERTGV